MARISGVDIPRDKRVDVSLSYIYGIGRPTADVEIVIICQRLARYGVAAPPAFTARAAARLPRLSASMAFWSTGRLVMSAYCVR